MPMQQH